MAWDDSDQKVLKEAIDKIVPTIQEFADTVGRLATAIENIEKIIKETSEETTDDE